MVDVDAQKPAIAITMGDPCGIGPEVVVKALADPRVYDSCRPMVIGNTYAMNQAVSATGLSLTIRETDDPTAAGEDPEIVDVVDIHNLNPEDITVGQLSVPCGKAAMEWVYQGRRAGPRRHCGRHRHRPPEQGSRRHGRLRVHRPHRTACRNCPARESCPPCSWPRTCGSST